MSGHPGLAALAAAFPDVEVDSGRLEEAHRCTYPAPQRFVARLRPRSQEEAVTALRIAHQHRLPVAPVSTGKNWGYGSRLAVRDGCVLLDLSALDRILDFSEELAYLVVEPGVTFRQAYDHLRARRSRLQLAMIGIAGVVLIGSGYALRRAHQ